MKAGKVTKLLEITKPTLLKKISDFSLDIEIKRVNVDFPMWVVDGLDKQATRLGITRQALIKVWIAERLG